MINKLIDHTLLKAFATNNEIKELCDQARKYDFASVCVNPCNVKSAKEFLVGSNVKVCTVIGFPLGANTKEIKKLETIDAINNGANEIDMVINVGKAKEHDYEYIYEEIKEVVLTANGNIVKVIIETCYLTQEEIKQVCYVATKAKANFVKTSTGFGPSGAKESDVALMKESISPNMEVKASGGIKTKEDLEKMVAAGATRIGTSKGVEILLNK